MKTATFCYKESSPLKKKKVKKGDIVPFWRPPPPKRVKRGHLLSDYRQKCVNGTRDSYCGVKSPFLSDLRLILTHIVVSKDSYWLILWCQKSISEWFENPVNLGLKKELGLTPQCPLFLPFFLNESFRYYTLQNSWSFPFNWISKDFFRRSKNSWKN